MPLSWQLACVEAKLAGQILQVWQVSAAPGHRAAFCLPSSAICMPTRQKIHFGKASQRACQGHDEAGNILKPLSCQCRAFLFIGTACCPMQANVNSAVTSAQALQISSLILPAGSWNGRRVREGSGEGRQVAGLATARKTWIFDFQHPCFAELNLFLPPFSWALNGCSLSAEWSRTGRYH